MTLQISDWWSESFAAAAEKLNDKFTIRFGKHFNTMIIKELISARLRLDSKRDQAKILTTGYALAYPNSPGGDRYDGKFNRNTTR